MNATSSDNNTHISHISIKQVLIQMFYLLLLNIPIKIIFQLKYLQKQSICISCRNVTHYFVAENTKTKNIHFIKANTLVYV